MLAVRSKLNFYVSSRQYSCVYTNSPHEGSTDSLWPPTLPPFIIHVCIIITLVRYCTINVYVIKTEYIHESCLFNSYLYTGTFYFRVTDEGNVDLNGDSDFLFCFLRLQILLFDIETHTQ